MGVYICWGASVCGGRGSGLCSAHLELERTPHGRIASAHLPPQLQQLDLLIVCYPSLVVAEEFIGLLYGLKLILLDRLQLRILHLVWMTFEDEFAVRTSDGGEFSIFRDSEGLVWIWWERVHGCAGEGGDVGGGVEGMAEGIII